MQDLAALRCPSRQLALGLLLSLVSLLPVAVHAETAAFDEDAVEAAVLRVFDDLARSARALEIDDYLKFFDRERFTALNPDGTVVHSFGAFEDAIRRDFAAVAGYESLEFDRVKVTVLDAETAILVNEYRAVLTLETGDSVTAAGAGTQVWKLVDGDWKLVSVSSSVRPAGAAGDVALPPPSDAAGPAA